MLRTDDETSETTTAAGIVGNPLSKRHTPGIATLTTTAP